MIDAGGIDAVTDVERIDLVEAVEEVEGNKGIANGLKSGGTG